MTKETGSYSVKVKQGEASLWQGKRPTLSNLDIELTERCNNYCIHCCINLPAGDREARKREMTSAQIKTILDQAASLGTLQVRFTGGEPLLRPDFEELYLYARRLGLKVLIFTNGRLITPHLADLLASVPPLIDVEITVYGMRPESYDAVSQVPGSFKQFWRGMQLLIEKKVPLIVKCALLPPNMNEIDEFEAFARTQVGMQKAPSYAMFLDLRGRRDSEEKNRLIRAMRLSPEEGLSILTRDPARYRKNMHEFCGKFMGKPGDRLFTCGAGLGGTVDAYGRLQMCMMLRDQETTVDLINTDSPEPLREALSEVFPKLRERRAVNPEYLKRCAVCFLKGLCEQCPAKSWSEHGMLDTPVEYVCKVAHAQARYLGLLEDGENAWEVRDGQARVERLAG